MWILPKQLHTSAFVPDTAALISDLDEQSQICEPSLLARSKPSLARTWSQRWKRDSWTQHLSGRILKPSHGQTFVTAWTSYLEVIPVSHLVQPGNDSEQKIHDTYGHLSQPELFPCDPESASLKTSRDTSASDSERSLANWKALVTRLRGEYSLRVKSAHLTNASASSSWASITANDWKGSTPNSITRKDGKSRIDQLAYQTEQHNLYYPTPCAMEAEKAGFHAKGQMGQSLSAMANRGELQWLTPATVQIQRADMQKRIDYRASIGRQYVPGSLEEQMQQHGQAVPVSHSTSGSRQESWGTPRCSMAQDKQEDSGKHRLGEQIQHGTMGKLNPRWVETLMGLPIGWTMPSCMSPMTIAQTNCDCSAMELCQQQQKELF